jgi:hypothetical protein
MNRNLRALHSQDSLALSEESALVRKLLRATLMVKRETSITGELWAAFTVRGAASKVAEIAISRARSPKRLRGETCGLYGRDVSSCCKANMGDTSAEVRYWHL